MAKQAEVIEKPKTTKKTTKTTNKKTTKTKSKKVVKPTELYYFYSVGCGWCKKTEPIVDELIAEGYPILKLDLADKDNQEVNKEVKEKYKVQCGTPWLIDPESGNSICGFREKDIIEKWAKGEEIPAPPRPKSPPPRPPFMEAPKKEEDKWKEDYTNWLKENDHLPTNQKKTADEILAMPRPKSQPPNPPNPKGTDEELETWGDTYDKWAKENSHLPNLQPRDVILSRFKAQRDSQSNPNVPNQPPGNPPIPPSSKHSDELNIEFYLIVENGKKINVYSDETYIRSLEHQYYIRNTNGKLTKVVGDINFKG